MSVAVPGPVWQAVHAATARGDWPPADAEAGAAFVGQAAREGLLPLLFFEPQGLPEAVRAALVAQGALRALACA
ncbi:MAG TPA: hypothetical protein VFO85_00500, partial [Vicinamibacteria bacterium]|nr:hypothetical protein [Vicinamibacteria bacterium]